MAALDLASSSSSAGSNAVSSSTYDVFISFRGEDTRKNFTGFLYKTLKDRGINAFLDSAKLWTGEIIGPALQKAIEGSKISIPVLSKGYADSKWCLQELAEIVECHRSNNQIILPIFFYIDPSDVRKQTGSFENAFLQHQKIFEPQKVDSWRKALTVVGNLKGEVLDDTKDQAELVELVAKRVLRELVDSTHLAESKYRIDMDSRVNDLLSLLDISSNNVQFIGICGFVGIGKTTLAKAVYNDISSTFNKRCFLSDVREQATQLGGLVSLQKQFLKDIFKEDFDIRDFHRGKSLIEERVSKEKVFLVLDDVDSKEQIDALAGSSDWFGCGSRVIITTRDKHILNLAKVNRDKIYMPQLLDHVHSLQLFSWHAFQTSQPPEDYMRLSHDVVYHSGGLPLILEVYGSYLSNTSDKDEWESTLTMLKEIPPEEVQRRLRISYDNLENDYQREIFLDAACFFIGWKKEIVISIWEAYGFHPKPALSTLIKRSLLKFDDECLMMHDHIRDMGRNIVIEENRTDPSKRSRLWSYGDIVEVLEGNKETHTIKGISLPYGLGRLLTMKSLEMLPNLRFLDVIGSPYYTELFGCESDRRFSMTNYLVNILPPNLYHRRLVYLNLSNCKVDRLWMVKPQDDQKRFQKLKIFDISNCFFGSKCMDFSWFPSLVHLYIGGCRLAELDESIGRLSQLKSLILHSCHSLKKLPDSIGDLKSLEKLELFLTKLEKLPDTISGMCSLKELILEMCSLKKLPDGVGLLEKLEVLDIRKCMELTKLPRSMGGMRCLHKIQLELIGKTEFFHDFSMPANLVKLEIDLLPLLRSLPVSLSALKTLKQLKICRCKRFEYLPVLPSCLVELCVENCNSLVQLPDLSKLKMLTKLKLTYCEKLVEVPGLKELESLGELDARGSYNLTRTHKKIQGKLLPKDKSQATSYGYSLTANQRIYNSGFILCLVLEMRSILDYHLKLEVGHPISFNIDISASIHQKDKKISCFHTLRVTDLDNIIDRDVIYICHFKGFDWFGVPLHENDAVESINIDELGYPVKFWGVLFENGEFGTQQKPCQNSNTLNWSYVDDDGGVITLNYWPIQHGRRVLFSGQYIPELTGC